MGDLPLMFRSACLSAKKKKALLPSFLNLVLVSVTHFWPVFLREF